MIVKGVSDSSARCGPMSRRIAVLRYHKIIFLTREVTLCRSLIVNV